MSMGSNMSNELKAAVERMRIKKDQGISVAYGPKSNHSYLVDCEMLIDAYLFDLAERERQKGNTSELKAAAERLTGPCYSAIGPASVIAKLWEDGRLLADAYLADLAERERQAVEDALPVTEEWLLRHGWEKYVVWPSIELPNGDLLEWRAGGLWIGEIAICLMKTRGQVRKLLKALGVKPKKGG